MNGLIVDSFAGGGGTSTGVERALGRPVDIAINHDPIAIAMHRANHPETKHYVESVWQVDPREACGGRPVGLAWFSPDCFPAGTLVLTSTGYRPIERIGIGELVLTHLGRYRRVTEVMSTVRALVTVRGQGHPGLRVSSEHPFYTRSAHNVWDNERRSYRRTLSAPTWTKATDLRTAGAPTNAAGGDLSFWATPCRFPRLPIPEIGGRGMACDERLMWLAGRYVGDGWSRLTETRAELVITCSGSEAPALRETLSAWTRQGARAGYDELAWHERDTATAHQFTTSHRGLVSWLREHFGHGAASKGLPGWALGMAVPLAQALLDGYVSADGHTRKISGGDVTQCTTVSKALAFGLRALAERLGFTAQVNGPYPNRAKIEGRRVNALPAWTVKWRHVAQRRQNVRDGAHNWTRVRSVESGSGEDTVFNLSVDEDESYVAEGVVVHNCTHHSKAKGGKPRKKKIRGLAWVVVRWARAVRPRVIVLENVEEFASWGPLGDDDRPDRARSGETFRAFCAKLASYGYAIEHRLLVAADYGTPTTRKRLFLIARCDGKPIVWPEATHGRGLEQPWRTAAEVIDWSHACPSIFERARPLKPATLARIAKGVQRYVLGAARPFIIPVTHPRDARVHSLDEPLRTVTAAHRGELALVTPFVSSQFGQSVGRPLSSPCPTVTAGGGGHQALVVPTLIQTGYGERRGQEPRVPGLHKPLGTVVAGGAKHALVAALITKHYGGVTGHEVDRTLGTITTKDHHSLTAAFLTKFYGTSTGSECGKPVPTVTAAGGHLGAVQALLERHAPPRTLFDEPHGVVTIAGERYVITDIGMRMLQPRELFRAQGFPDSYLIDLTRPTDGKPFTKGNQIALAGNAVPPQLSEAIVAANLGASAQAAVA